MRRPPDTVNPQIWRESLKTGAWSCRGQNANRGGCIPEGAGAEVRDAVRSRAFFSAELGDKGLG